jgi:hypothetical protein
VLWRHFSIHGGVARHGLEHLATTDRGVTMMRNMIRRGIRAVRNGESLDYRILRDGTAIPTYCHDRVISGMTTAPTPEEDRRMLRERGRNVVEESVRVGLANT